MQHLKIGKALSVFVVLAMLVISGCSSDESIGSGVEAGKKGDGDSNAALRDSNTTIADAAATTAPPGTAAPNTTAAPATTAPPTTQPEPENIIKIQDDEKGSYFAPVVFQIPVGGLIVWRNESSEERSVIADDGSFQSPSIPPGGSFRWKATGPGRVINYTDGTRPYAQAQVQVY